SAPTDWISRICRGRRAGCWSGQCLNFLWCSAKTGPLQQMRREIVIPIRGTYGRKIVLPCSRSGGLGDNGSRRECNRRYNRQKGNEKVQSSKHVPTPSNLAMKIFHKIPQRCRPCSQRPVQSVATNQLEPWLLRSQKCDLL